MRWFLAGALLGWCSAAHGELNSSPPFPRVSIQVQPGSPPIAEFRLICIEGLDNPAMYPTARIIQRFSDNPHPVPVGLMANGDWSCYVEAHSAETVRRVFVTDNRVSFTLGPPKYSLLIE